LLADHQLTDHQLTDHVIAARLAVAAGDLLVALRSSGPSGAELGRRGDLASHQLIASAIAELRPGDILLSEEGDDDPRRIGADRVWIVDPLDGTREYIDGDRADWAVHVAIVDIEGRPRAAAVALPAEGLVFVTDPPPSVPPILQGTPRIVVSRTRPAREATKVATALGAELVGLGSAGAKAMAVVRGQAEIYVHSGGQYEWDSCAPVAVAAAAGLHCSRIDGEPLVYNRPDVYLPDLLICHPALAEEVLRVLAG